MARILISGLGRSGTTWALKTFDHHPDVLAAHEPELVLGPRTLWRNIESEDPAKIRALVEALFATRGLRAMRRRPILKKPYRSTPAHMLRLSYIYLLSVLGRLGFERFVRKAHIPDLARLDGVTQVIKTVSLEAGSEKIARNYPDTKIVYIMRHPCGQALSFLEGIRQGEMVGKFLPPWEAAQPLFDLPDAEAYHEDNFRDIEIISYKWAVFCDLNFRAAERHANIRIVRYEDLCADPIGAFRDLFDWCDLGWGAECQAFLEQSLAEDADSDGYHSLVRNPLIAANKWRDRMSSEDIATVVRICRRSAAAKLFPDLE